MILRDLDTKIMESLSKALKMKRHKIVHSRSFIAFNNPIKINKAVKPRHRKLKDRANPTSKVFSGHLPSLKPNSMN